MVLMRAETRRCKRAHRGHRANFCFRLLLPCDTYYITRSRCRARSRLRPQLACRSHLTRTNAGQGRVQRRRRSPAALPASTTATCRHQPLEATRHLDRLTQTTVRLPNSAPLARESSPFETAAYNSSRGSDHELSESNPPRRDRISPPLPPSLPPNPYTARTTSRAPPLPTPRPPSGARAATNTDRWRQPQYPCYLPASAPCTTDSGLDQASRNDPPHSFAQASHGNVAHDDDETAASLHPRDSIASGIISMYGGDPAGSRNPNAPAYPSASANATTSQYPEPSVSATQQYNQQWSRSASQSISSPYRRHQVLPAAPKTGQVSPQSLSFSSQQSYTSSATPYSSSSAAQANNSAAVDRADSRATIVQGSSASLRSIPSRQPSIVTPPPVITRSSSVDSPTDQSAWTSSFASFDTRKASLTPHSSYTAFPGVTRANTGDSFDDSDVKDASDTNACLLSDIAVFVKSHVPRATRSKGPLEHPCSFTGSDVVVSFCLVHFHGHQS